MTNKRQVGVSEAKVEKRKENEEDRRSSRKVPLTRFVMKCCLRALIKSFIEPITKSGLFAIFPLCQIAIGYIYVDECPADPYIPMWLISMGLFILYLFAWKYQTSRRYYVNEFSMYATISLWFFCFITYGDNGFVALYSIYDKVQYQDLAVTETYCNIIPFRLSLLTIATIFVHLIAYVLLLTCYSFGVLDLQSDCADLLY